LKVDGVTVAGFAADKLNYSVVLQREQLYQITAVTKRTVKHRNVTQASALLALLL
jgi:hypothetical protein